MIYRFFSALFFSILAVLSLATAESRIQFSGSCGAQVSTSGVGNSTWRSHLPSGLRRFRGELSLGLAEGVMLSDGQLFYQGRRGVNTPVPLSVRVESSIFINCYEVGTAVHCGVGSNIHQDHRLEGDNAGAQLARVQNSFSLVELPAAQSAKTTTAHGITILDCDPGWSLLGIDAPGVNARFDCDLQFSRE